MKNDTAEGPVGNAPQTWPQDSPLQRSADRFALVLLAHPECSCTRAGIGELEQLMARLPGRLNAWVLFHKPESSFEEMSSSRLWKKAAAIPGVTVVHDPSGDEDRRFGAFVSGQAVLYDPAGILAFEGGITLGRGHEGHSPGEDYIVRAVRGGTSPRVQDQSLRLFAAQSG